jgi:hypothetical protein
MELDVDILNTVRGRPLYPQLSLKQVYEALSY